MIFFQTWVKAVPSFVVAAQWLSYDGLSVTPWTAACQASLCFTVSWSSLRFTSAVSAMPSDHLILRCPLLLLPPIVPRFVKTNGPVCQPLTQMTRYRLNDVYTHRRWI